MELMYWLLSTDWKKNQSKMWHASYRLIGLDYYIVIGKIIILSNSLITSRVKFFQHFVEESYCYYFISGEISKLFDKESEKFDLIRNWAVIGEFMTLPVAIISSL